MINNKNISNLMPRGLGRRSPGGGRGVGEVNNDAVSTVGSGQYAQAEKARPEGVV